MFRNPVAAAPSAPEIRFLTQGNNYNISLNPGRFYLPSGEEVLVDAADFDRVRALSWHAHRRKNLIYAVRRRKLGGGHRSRLLLHRFILDAPPGIRIDHENGNGLDCRRINLRFCTHPQNMQNARIGPNAAGFRGVRKAHSGNGKFIAAIKGRHIGTFANARDAALAWDSVARELYGKFARLNFPNVGSEL